MKRLLTVLLLISGAVGTAQTFKNITEKSNGFVGIGTTDPDAMLTVNGTIHTREVQVDLDGAVAPDYVFQKYFTGKSALKNGYRMMSLFEVNHYIEQHHHLPGIPSAVQMQSEGINLKDLQLLLLEKIEELTLYTIEQQQEIDRLKTRLNALENE